MRPGIELIQIDLAAERVAMYPEQPGGLRLIAVEAFQYSLDEFLFKFVDRFIEVDSALDHQPDECFQLFFHRSTLRTRGICSRMIPPAWLAEFVAC